MLPAAFSRNFLCSLKNMKTALMGNSGFFCAKIGVFRSNAIPGYLRQRIWPND
jgi:hypothetical protein